MLVTCNALANFVTWPSPFASVRVYQLLAKLTGMVAVSVMLFTKLTIRLVEPSCKDGVGRKLVPTTVTFIGRFCGLIVDGVMLVKVGGLIAAISTLFVSLDPPIA